MSGINETPHIKPVITKKRHSDDLFKIVFNNTNDAITIINIHDFTITAANVTFLQQQGLKEDEVIGKACYQITHHRSDPCMPPDDICPLLDTIATGNHSVAEHVHYDKVNEKVYVEVATTPIKDADGKVNQVIHVTKNITERKQAEDKLEQLYKQEKELRQILENDMKRRVEFANTLVHELKTPLVPVIAASELLADQVHDEVLLRIIGSIQRGASTLNTRIDTLLDVARGELGMLELQYKEVDILKLFNQIAEVLSPMASIQEQSFLLDVPSSLPSVWADEGRLEQVITNILANAMKYTPMRGTITLRAKEKDYGLLVEVQDTGSGIAEEHWQKIFETYHRVENGKYRPAGLGLGLALCKAIVDAHGGQIWLESELGKGSTFSFSIPLSRL
ncbi:ATP-binding protein [Chloroflexota bacterium]